MSNCYKTSDNKHPECPPRMADGRHFTDYRPNCHVNDLLRADNQISNSFQYRVFLQQNAGEIMDKHREIACSKNCCSPCGNNNGNGEGENFENTTMLPEKYMQVCNENTCKVLLNDVNGVGMGRQHYCFNDCDEVPSAYPKPNQGQNQCATPYDNMALNGALYGQTQEMQRVAVPGAGKVN
jgi:hypothetical protein